MRIPTQFGFRAVLFRMVPKPHFDCCRIGISFRAVLFRMVPKHEEVERIENAGFRAVLFRMVPKPLKYIILYYFRF